VRSLFGAIEAGIRVTAPRSALRGLLATMRDQQRATEAEIIARGQRRRQTLAAFARAARAALAQQERGAQRPAPRRWRVTLLRGAAR
jgi:hypothetical protein